MPLPKQERNWPQAASGTITGIIRDENQTVIPSASLDALTLTIYDEHTGEIINSRSNQDILNTNNVTVHATSGLFTWLVQPADLPIMDDLRVRFGATEKHVILIKWTYASGTKFGQDEFDMLVENVRKVENV